MDRSERLALAVRAHVADIRSGEARRRQSLLERWHRTAATAGAAQAELGDAMGEYPGAIWTWIGCTEQELHGAVRAALNDHYLRPRTPSPPGPGLTGPGLILSDYASTVTSKISGASNRMPRASSGPCAVCAS